MNLDEVILRWARTGRFAHAGVCRGGIRSGMEFESGSWRDAVIALRLPCHKCLRSGPLTDLFIDGLIVYATCGIKAVRDSTEREIRITAADVRSENWLVSTHEGALTTMVLS